MVAFEIPDALLIPEGIAHDPISGDFFVGSTYKRKVVRVSADGSISDFIDTARDGVWGIVGMRVDPSRRTLWFASSHAGDGMPMVDMVPREEGQSGLFGYNIDTGELQHRHVLSEDSHFLNDVAVTRAGVVYVTDSQSGWVFRFDPATLAFDPFVDLSQYGGPNGIDVTPDDQALFVAVGRGIVRVTLPTAATTSILDSDDGTGVIDGLYYHDGNLLIVTPFSDDNAVMLLRLSDRDFIVTSSEGLLNATPLLDQPSTGAVVGDTLFVIANSHLQTFRRAWTVGALDTLGVGLHEVRVLRVVIPR